MFEQIHDIIVSQVMLFFPRWYYSYWVSNLCVVGVSVIECSGHACGQAHGRELMAAWQLPCSQPQGHQHSRHHTGRWAETGTILLTLDTYKIPPGLVIPLNTKTCPAVVVGRPPSRIITTLGFQCTGGQFKDEYELVNLRALKFSTVYEKRIFQYMDKIFCVEFQRYP